MVGKIKPPQGGAAKDVLLRRRAENQALQSEALSRKSEVALTPETARQMLHELHVHQIELEMQNEELRRTQVALEAAHLRYFDLYDLAPVGYCSVTDRGMIVQANLAAATLLGLSRAALAKQRIGTIIFKADQDIFYLCRRRVLATGDTQSCELRLVKSDGTPVWVQLAVSAAVDADDEPMMRIVMSDIGERKVMHAAMEEREARYRAMVEWLPEPVAVQRDGVIIYANGAALKLFGMTHVTDLVGRPALQRVHPDFHALAHARAHAMVQGSAPAPVAEMVLLRMDGTPVNVEVQSIQTIFDGAPAIQSVMHDITERVRMGKVLLARNSELESARAVADAANRAKSDFLSGMSHELRTPLGTILGYAQLLESGTPPPSPAQKRNIDQILHAGWYLLEMVNEVLDLATIESGKLSLSLEPTSLASVLLECRAMVEPLATRRALVLSFPEVPVSLRVQADRMRLKQVLINLLSNAIKYNQAGGSVTVTSQACPPGRTRRCISDTGPGLSAQEVAQLFHHFNRLGQERTSEQGTGIGLVMCERLIQLMGGAIGVTSVPGEGSVFWVELSIVPALETGARGVPS